jgi:hypothetical protein
MNARELPEVSCSSAKRPRLAPPAILLGGRQKQSALFAAKSSLGTSISWKPKIALRLPPWSDLVAQALLPVPRVRLKQIGQPTVAPPLEPMERIIRESNERGPQFLEVTPLSERCEKYPSMERRFCSHCQGPALGTRENPYFSIREDEYDGYPVVEILKNGGPIHADDANFRFGVRKAEMLLACLPALKTFGWGSDKERYSFQPQTFEDREIGISVFVEMHPNFVRSTGELINEPWLQLETTPQTESPLRLGVMKCKAVCSVQDELRAWVRRFRR